MDARDWIPPLAAVLFAGMAWLFLLYERHKLHKARRKENRCGECGRKFGG